MSAVNWSEHFAHTGTGGSTRYEETISHCAATIAHLLETTRAPYSGLAPSRLEQLIQSINYSASAVAPLSHVVQEVQEKIAAHAIVVQHPHCIAHLHTPPTLSGLAAECFIAAQNLSMDSWDQSGSATYVEQHVIRHLCALFGYPDEADGTFTSGGTQGNIMALLMARDHYVERTFGLRVQTEGMPPEANRLRILASCDSHFTVQKAAAIMGLGHHAVIKVATDANGRMDPLILETTLQNLTAAGLLPFAVVGTAGTTDQGSIDPLSDISRIAKKHQLWFHVDAAYGSALILGQAKDRLAGIDQADSMVIDFHKLWFQPVSCGALLLRERDHFNHLLYKSHYLNRETDDLPNLVDKTLSTTRRFDALKVHMMLRAVGASTMGDMVDHLLAQTQRVAAMIERHAAFELMCQPSLTTVLFRCTLDKARGQLDVFNRWLRSGLLQHGMAVLGETTVHSSTALKLTLLNPCLRDADFEDLLEKILQFAHQFSEETTMALA